MAEGQSSSPRGAGCPGPSVKRRAPLGGAVLALAMALGAPGCAGPPWYMGAPLGGKPAIPPTSLAKTVAEDRAEADDARAAGDRVGELAALAVLEQRAALRPNEQKRFVELLAQRVRDWTALGRPIPLASDLRHIVALWPARALPLGPRLRNAELAAGDRWLALGENSRAEAEYRDAEKLGAEAMDIRFRAVWGVSVADLDDASLQRALARLPERVLAPFAAQYLDRGGTEPRLLRRAWSASRTYGPSALRARLEALPEAPSFSTPIAPEADASDAGGARPPAAPPQPVTEPAADDLLSSGPTLARALLPAVASFPQLLSPGPRARLWAERLVAEDPTSPDSLEVAALIDARAGRMGGAEQKLGDLVFFSVDRAAGYERAARVWEQVGDVRRACWAWERATRVAPVDDPRWCSLLACARRDPGGADADQIATHIRARAPQLACVAPPPAGPDESPSAPTDESAPPPAFPSDGGAPAPPPAGDPG